MSPANEETARRAVQHLRQTGEPEWGRYDPELVWTTRRDGPAHYTYHGLDGLSRGLRSLREVWADINAEVVEVRGEADVLLVTIRWQLRSHSGVELKVVEAWATWFRDGKITRIEQHGTGREAIEATQRME